MILLLKFVKVHAFAKWLFNYFWTKMQKHTLAVIYKNAVLKNFAVFTGKHLSYEVSF